MKKVFVLITAAMFSVAVMAGTPEKTDQKSKTEPAKKECAHKATGEHKCAKAEGKPCCAKAQKSGAQAEKKACSQGEKSGCPHAKKAAEAKKAEVKK